MLGGRGWKWEWERGGEFKRNRWLGEAEFVGEGRPSVVYISAGSETLVST